MHIKQLRLKWLPEMVTIGDGHWPLNGRQNEKQLQNDPKAGSLMSFGRQGFKSEFENSYGYHLDRYIQWIVEFR